MQQPNETMRYATKVGRLPTTPIPVVLPDTSALLELAIAVEQMPNTLPNSATHQSYSFTELMQKLGQGRTIVLTRDVLRELIPLTVGRLDLAGETPDHWQIPEGIAPCMVQKEGSLGLYNWLQTAQQQGQLRTYPSIDAMMKAGELEAGRGGVVIVDTQARISDIMPDGIRRSATREFYPPTGAVLDNLAERVRTYPDKVDWGRRSVHTLSQCISDQGKANGKAYQPLVLSRDIRLLKTIQDDQSISVWPIMPRTYELLGGMALHEKTQQSKANFFNFREAIDRLRQMQQQEPLPQLPYEPEKKSIARTFEWFNAIGRHQEKSPGK